MSTGQSYGHHSHHALRWPCHQQDLNRQSGLFARTSGSWCDLSLVGLPPVECTHADNYRLPVDLCSLKQKNPPEVTNELYPAKAIRLPLSPGSHFLLPFLPDPVTSNRKV